MENFFNLFALLLCALALGVGAGIIGAVYRFVLAYEPILNWWFRFGARFECFAIFKPVWGCCKCISGQIAGWAWVLLAILPVVARHLRQGGQIFRFPIHCAQTVAVLLFGLILSISAGVASGLFFGIAIENAKRKEA